jgi:hypothetical protein
MRKAVLCYWISPRKPALDWVLKNGGMDRKQAFSAIPHCGLSTGI